DDHRAGNADEGAEAGYRVRSRATITNAAGASPRWSSGSSGWPRSGRFYATVLTTKSVSEKREHASSRPASPAKARAIRSRIARVTRLPGASSAFLERSPGQEPPRRRPAAPRLVALAAFAL